MSRPLFGTGAHGAAVEQIQLALGVTPDAIYGNETAAAVASFQRANGLPPSGQTGADTWAALLAAPIPSLFERCLAVTAAFEGHGFSLVQGNFDGAGLTWGIIGFTLRSGSLADVIARIDARGPGAIDNAFGPLSAELRSKLALPWSRGLEWVQSISLGTGLAEPWRAAFQRLGTDPAARRAQVETAHRLYFERAAATAREMGLNDELSHALCFDIQVQNGGIKSGVKRKLRDYARTARERRELLARQTAASASPQWRADVLSRKLTLALGAGRVHGRYYDLANWGLGEYLARDVLDTGGP